MGYSYMYLGDAAFPPGALDRWLATRPSGAAFEDWPSRWKLYDQEAGDEVETVREVIDFLAAEQFSEIEIARDRIRVRTLVAKDGDGWLTFRGPLAAAFRLVGGFGGTATLYAITGTDAASDSGFLVESAPGDDRCISLSGASVAAARASAAGRELHAVVERWLAGNR